MLKIVWCDNRRICHRQ